jgi:hypothetical protein
MSKELRIKDVNESLVAYFEQFGVMPKPRYQRAIISTVRTYDDWIVFVTLLAAWGYFRNGEWHQRDAADVPGLLRCFEFKRRERQRAGL